jgi:hypothetical protein
MESLIPKLLNRLKELGLFECHLLPYITLDKKYIAFFDKTTQLISICENGGDLSRILPGMMGGGNGFTRICHLRSGSVVWTGEASNYDSQFVEGILTEIITLLEARRPPTGEPELFHDGKGNLLELAEGKGGLISRMMRRISLSATLSKLREGEPTQLGKLRASLTEDDYVRSLEVKLRMTFADDKKYAEYLQRLIQLQEMSPEEFVIDSKRSAQELEQIYPQHARLVPNVIDTEDRLVMGNTMQSTLADLGHYIPDKDEPSPFGHDQRGYVDNPWVVWKRKQPGGEGPDVGSATVQRVFLLERLGYGKYRSQADRECVPFEIQTSDGKLSLGYVIHMRYSRNMSWDEAHTYGLSKIEQLNQSR